MLSPQTNFNNKLDLYIPEPKIDLPKIEPELLLEPTFEILPNNNRTANSNQDRQDEDLDFGLLWRELAGLRLDEVFALSRLNLFPDPKSR